MESINNYISITSKPNLKMSLDGDFFRTWVEFLRPTHNLTKREMDVFAMFLKKRYELSKSISDSKSLDKVLMSRETKKEIRQACGIKTKHLQVTMCKLRKKGVLLRDTMNNEDRIYLNLVPSISEDGVGLMIYFDFDDKQHSKSSPEPSIQKTGYRQEAG